MSFRFGQPSISWGWITITSIVAVPLIMWFGMMPVASRFDNSYAILSSIGRIAGLIAILFFCLNLILSTRLRVIEDLFGGLNKAYIAHHIVGGVSICLVLLHSMTLALRLAGTSMHDAALLMLPSSKDWPTTFGVLALWLFALLMFLTFYVKLPYRVWLLTHKLLGVAFIGIALHIIFISSDTTANPYLKWYLLFFVALGSVAFVYRTLLSRFLIRKYAYSIASVSQPTEGVVRFHLQPKATPMSYKAGQFVFVSFRMNGISHQWHPFSISSNPKESLLTITVKNLGKYTDTITKLGPNMIHSDVLVEGSYGRFLFKKMAHKRQIWIAGGIGVTPFLAMLSEIDEVYQVDLYYCVKAADEIIDWPAIHEITKSKPQQVRVIPIIANHQEHLTANKVHKISGSLDNCEILVCGPPPMMHALKDQFIGMGVQKKRIHIEEFALT